MNVVNKGCVCVSSDYYVVHVFAIDWINIKDDQRELMSTEKALFLNV